MNTVESLYFGHLGDLLKCPEYIERCPYFRGKFIFRKHIWDTAKCPYYRCVLILVGVL